MRGAASEPGLSKWFFLVFAGIYMTPARIPRVDGTCVNFFPALACARFFYPNFLVQEFFFAIVQTPPPHPTTPHPHSPPEKLNGPSLRKKIFSLFFHKLFFIPNTFFTTLAQLTNLLLKIGKH